ncbi:MAG: YbgC/FadM family acyl-CoA thioesterase [Hyphomonadaceae bacterium]
MTNPPTAPPESRPASGPPPAAGELREREHLLGLRVYYEDTDFTGVVYHANYLRFMERGRSEFLRMLEARAAPEAHAAGAFAVVRAEIDYKAPARIHDALLVRTRVVEARGPRLVFEQTVERDGKILCAGRITAVPIHPDGRVRRPRPEEIGLWTSVLHSSDSKS